LLPWLHARDYNTPGLWKRRARRLPIGQIQAVPGNFLLSGSPRGETRLARPSHDLLCRSTSSFSFPPLPSSPPPPPVFLYDRFCSGITLLPHHLVAIVAICGDKLSRCTSARRFQCLRSIVNLTSEDQIAILFPVLSPIYICHNNSSARLCNTLQFP